MRIHMFTTLNRISYPILIAGLLAVTQGCKTPPPLREPLVLDQAFNPTAVVSITILPVVDLRVDKKSKVNLTRIVQRNAVYCLKKRGYTAKETNVEPPAANLTEEDLKKPATEWVKSLPPADARWVMLFAAQDVASGFKMEQVIILTQTANAELSAFLYDKQSGKCVWHDRGVGQASAGGLLGSLDPFINDDAVGRATLDALTALPTKPKP